MATENMTPEAQAVIDAALAAAMDAVPGMMKGRDALVVVAGYAPDRAAATRELWQGSVARTCVFGARGPVAVLALPDATLARVFEGLPRPDAPFVLWVLHPGGVHAAGARLEAAPPVVGGGN